MRKIVLGAFIADMIILPVLYIRLSYSLKIIPVVAATLDNNSVDLENMIPVGVETLNFMQLLKNNNFVPIVFKKITRHPFTGDGRMIILNGDNIQIFEYADHDSAVRDASLFAEKYTTGTKKLIWKKNMHVYVEGTLVIFYLGTEKSILTSLNQNAVAFLTQPNKNIISVVSAVSKIKH